jgi:hypothetical protein
MKSPFQAMLWELWRVTRTEIAWRLALPIGAGLAALALFAAFAPDQDTKDLGAVIALALLVVPSFVGWLSPADPKRLYTRPVRTAVIVGLPMAYLTIVPAATYLTSALLLRAISGYPFPLLSVAALIAVLTVVFVAIGYSSRSIVALTLGIMVAFLAWGRLVGDRVSSFPDGFNWHDSPTLWPTIFDFPLTDYALFALIGLASFVVTVATIARKRRGDAQGLSLTPGSGLHGRLIDLFRIPCPTSSATRAQVWFDLKSTGLPVVTIGVVIAIVILLLSALGNPIDAAFADEVRAHLSCENADCFYARAWPVFLTPLSLLIVLGLARNAFGIRRRQGRAYMSGFEVTQAHGTAQLALLKVLVRSVCILAAIIAIGVSVWISVPLLGDPVFIQVWNVPLSSRLPGAVAALTGYEQLSLLVVAVVGVVIWVAAFAVFGALRARYSRRVNIAASLLLLFVVAPAVLVVAFSIGYVSERTGLVVLATIGWIAAAAVILVAVYVVWIGFTERVLTIRYASGAVTISAAFGAAWLTVLHMAGVQLAGMSAIAAVSILSPALLPLIFSVLAPWSLNRVRHT